MEQYGAFARYYDLLMQSADYRAVSQRLHAALRENGISSGILLDLACGTGTLSLLMEKLGYDVIGVDISEQMLSCAQEKKLGSGSSCLFLRQDITRLDLYGTVDAAVCTMDSLNHITREDKLERVFYGASLFMNDGGLFIFDVNTPYKHEQVLSNNSFVYDLDEVFCVWQNRFFEKKCLTEVTLDFFCPCEDELYLRESERFFERGYSVEYLTELAQRHRFEVLGVTDADSGGSLSQTSQRAMFVLKKHGTQLI